MREVVAHVTAYLGIVGDAGELVNVGGFVVPDCDFWKVDDGTRGVRFDFLILALFLNSVGGSRWLRGSWNGHDGVFGFVGK